MKTNRGNDTDFLCIGSITKPHGIHGELKVVPGLHWQNVFQSLEKCFLRFEDQPGEWKTIRNVRAQKENIILQLDDVETRNNAENYRGYDLYVQQDQIPEMPNDMYLVSDLIGLTVQSQDGKYLGNIKEVMHMPAYEIYVIDTGKDEVLVPAVKEFVKQVDLGNSRMIIQPIDGMFDNDAD